RRGAFGRAERRLDDFELSTRVRGAAIRHEADLDVMPSCGLDECLDTIAVGRREQENPRTWNRGVAHRLGSNTMKLVLFAWCSTWRPYLDVVAGIDARLVLVVTGAEVCDGLRAACDERRIPLARCTDVNAPGFVSRIEELDADLLVVAGCA